MLEQGHDPQTTETEVPRTSETDPYLARNAPFAGLAVDKYFVTAAVDRVTIKPQNDGRLSSRKICAE